MLTGLIRYFIIAYSSKYIFQKIQNAPAVRFFFLLNILTSVLSSLLTSAVSSQILGLDIPVLLLLNFLFCWFIYRKKIASIFVAAVISLAASYMFLILSAIAIFPIYYIFQASHITLFFDLLTIVLTGIIQLLCIFLFFRIKRFRNGIPNFGESYTNNIGVFISTTLLLMIAISNMGGEPNASLIIFVLIILSSLIVFIELRKHISDTYKSKVQTKNMEILEGTLKTQSEELNILKTEIDSLSKIIHRDNKILPAMVGTVKEVTKSVNTIEVFTLLTELEVLLNEREGALTHYESSNKQLAKTNIVTLDALLNYLVSRATEYAVSIDLSILGNAKVLIDKHLSESDLRTLVGDLAENALIAVKNTKNGKVLILIDVTGTIPFIHFYDNGTNFDSKVIQKMGRHRYTTHSTEGGSGIGLMQTFELLNTYQASFELEEFSQDSMFIKRVSIVFDNLSEIRIISNRLDVRDACSKRDAIILQKPN